VGVEILHLASWILYLGGRVGSHRPSIARPQDSMGKQLKRIDVQLLVTTTEAPLAFFLIDSTPFMQASLDL
jgi:hypothetical protein